MNICVETKYHVAVIYLGNVLSGFLVLCINSPASLRSGFKHNPELKHGMCI